MNYKKANLLFVTYFYPPIGGQGLPGAQRAVKFIRYMQRYDITVLTVKEENYPEGAVLNFNRNLPINNEKIRRTSFRNIFDYVLIIRQFLNKVLVRNSKNQDASYATSEKTSVPQVNNENISFLQRVKDFIYELCNFPDVASGWIVPAVGEGRRLLKEQKFDVIIATGMPWSALVIAWILHKLSGVKLVVDFRDPWVGNPFDTSNQGFFYRIKCLLERKIVQDAALVSANTSVLKDEFIARYKGKVDTQKFIVLPNGFDPEDFSSVGDAVQTHTDVLAAPLVLAHAGFLYGRRDPSPILEAIIHLEKQGVAPANSFRFVQMGNIHMEYDLLEKYKDLVMRGVIVDLGAYPFDECLKKLTTADVLLLIQPGTKSQVPSKLYDYLCLHRPILTMTPLDGALGDMIRENGFGDIFAPDDIDGIAVRLGELLNEKHTNGVLRADYQHRHLFDIRNIVADLEQSIDYILSQNKTT